MSLTFFYFFLFLGLYCSFRIELGASVECLRHSQFPKCLNNDICRAVYKRL